MLRTQKTSEQLRVTQRRIETALLGIRLRDRVTNMDITRGTKVKDIVERIARVHWQ